MSQLALDPSPQPSLLRVPHAEPLGSPRAWALHFAVVGGVSPLLVSLLVMNASRVVPFALAAGLIGGLSGAALGAAIPVALLRAARRMPVLALGVAAAGLGAWWGALWCAVGALASGAPVVLLAQSGAYFGFWQLGLLSLPYLYARAKGCDARPWVALAVLGTPLLVGLAELCVG